MSQLGAAALAAPAPDEQRVAPVDVVYSPPGFDTTDDALLVLAGQFPNTCWRLGDVTAAVDQDTRAITITAMATVPSGLMCAQVMVPFDYTLHLGQLAAGTYTVEVVGRAGIDTTPLVIDEVTRGRDAVLVPVQEVSIERDGSGQAMLYLSGEFPYTFVGCMVFREITVDPTDDGILDVTPYAEFADGDRCVKQNDTKAFRTSVPVDVADGRYLLHVREPTGMTLDRVATLD
jgi:hypothetical protein